MDNSVSNTTIDEHGSLWRQSSLLSILTEYRSSSYCCSYRVIFALIFLAYLHLIQFARFRRRKEIVGYVHAQLPLTPAKAQDVVHRIAQLEFPMIFQKALEFALFRTYGIPTISELLVKTSLFSTPATAGQRYVDTKVLVGEFIGRRWGSEEWIVPIARVNAIHGHYRDSGKISEADMLYTLILFAQQVRRWIDRFEWRTLTQEECNALGTFWQGVAEVMEIQLDGLGLSGWNEDPDVSISANGHGRGVWKDGAEWLGAVSQWAEKYEQRHMISSTSNTIVAEETIKLLLYEVPTLLHPFGRHVVSAMMDVRLRKAMAIKPPPSWVLYTVMAVLFARRFVLRWLVPPRPNWLKVQVMTETHMASPEGKHFLLYYESLPHFIKPTLFNRWGPRAWIRWIRGQPLPGDEGMRSDGYFPVEVGPPIGKRRGEQTRQERRIEDVLAGKKCPLAFSR